MFFIDFHAKLALLISNSPLLQKKNKGKLTFFYLFNFLEMDILVRHETGHDVFLRRNAGN